MTRSLTFTQPCDTLEFPSETRATCLGTTDQLLPALPSPTPPSPKDTIWHPIIESGKQLQLNTSHSIGKMAKETLLTFSANIGSLQLCGPCSTLSCSGGRDCHPGFPSTNPGAEPTRDARDSDSARLHSMHLETSSSDRPSMVTYMEPQTVPSYISVTCTQRTLRKPNFTRATHSQPSLSNISKWDLNFGEPAHSCGTT